MKKTLLITLVLICALLEIAPAQTLNLSPAVPSNIMLVRKDTVAATDSSWIMYCPYSMNILEIYAVAATADTGAASPASVITFYKFNPTTNIAGSAICTVTLLANNTVAYSKPATSAIAKLEPGSYYKLKYVEGTSDHLYNSNVFIVWAR